MAISFNPSTKIISLSSGTVSLDVRDLYSRWKDWVQISDNTKYLPAFRTVGGDTIDAGAGTSVPFYAFLLNGWRIRPQEASHTVNVGGGVLVVDGGGDPFVNTVGSFVVRINYQQPVQAIGYSTSGGGGSSGPDAPTIAAAVWAKVIEAGLPAEDLLRIMVAALAGNATGLESANPRFTGLDGTTVRIDADYDAGNRTINSLIGN